MLLSLVLLNVLSHNCDDIFFKVICDSHDKCLWKNYNCIDTTSTSTSMSTPKKLSGKKSSYKYSTTTTTEEPDVSLSKSKKTNTKTTPEDTTSSYSSSTTTRSTSTSSRTSTDTETSQSSTSTGKSTSITSTSTSTTKETKLIPPIDSTSDKPSVSFNGSITGKSEKQSSVKDIIIPSAVAGCISFLVVFLVYRRKRNAKDSPDTYLEPVTNNPAYSSPNEENETETDTALYALARTRETDENPIYDLSYEQIQTEQPRYEIPEPAYNLAQDIPHNKPVYSTATQQVITEPEYDLAEDETGYFEVGNQEVNYQLAD